MNLPIYQIDAFTSNIFEGNPAAVIPLEEWIEKKLMQNIAMENNLSETAFIVKSNNDYEIRWFTPKCEVGLCGHATLAAAHLIIYHLEPGRKKIRFFSSNHELVVEKKEDFLSLSLPKMSSQKIKISEDLIQGLGRKPGEVYQSDDLMAIYESQKDIKNIKPDFAILEKIEARGIIITAPGEKSDFVSRFFAPKAGISEDPVTGSAHTKLIPYWSERLGKKELFAEQLSHRPGKIFCINHKDHVELMGNARTYLAGMINTK